MQIICTPLQTDNHASTLPLSFYMPNSLPVPNEQRQSTEGTDETDNAVKYLLHATADYIFPLFWTILNIISAMWFFYTKMRLASHDKVIYKLECGPMPNVMATLPNTGGALCSTPQSLADAHN